VLALECPSLTFSQICKICEKVRLSSAITLFHVFRIAWVVLRSFCGVRFALRPNGVACPAPARTFTTELASMGSPLSSTSVMTRWAIVIYHHRTSTGWIVSIMGCESTTTSTRTIWLRLRRVVINAG
jgi:hypothetical protein